MKKPATLSEPTINFKLHLSSPDMQEREQTKEAERSAYRRRYWQSYKKRVRRVYGSISPDEYVAIQNIATANERTVWEQVISESRAYRSQTILPTPDIMVQQHQLLTELRRIGNNINQLTRLGHIKANKAGGLMAMPDDKIGLEVLRQFTRLEKTVATFAPLHGVPSAAIDYNGAL